ncbi:proline-rich transmembrane protein 1-like [Patiria miniata]|uniref:Uncharacterized protein n=1 Tax=Patiria miniata TaxID=46514 RepID=A0A913ZM78_PATMI|nr:proline-rich transmembrane protein 1-like [Patiria miniata]
MANYPPTQPQPAQGYAPPQYYASPPSVTAVQAVPPQPQTIISTSHVMPQDYFGLALFVTLCCCLPLGILGLIRSNDVRNRFLVGDIAGAEQASRQAKTYSYVGLGIGISLTVVSIVALIIDFSVPRDDEQKY